MELASRPPSARASMAADDKQGEGWVDRLFSYDLSGPFGGWVATLFKQLPLPALFMFFLGLTLDYRVMPAEELKLEALSLWGDFESRYQLAVLRDNNSRGGDIRSLGFYYLHRWKHRGCAVRFVEHVVQRASPSVAVMVRDSGSAQLYQLLDSDDSLAEASALSDFLAKSGEPDALMLRAAFLANEGLSRRLRSRGVFADSSSQLSPGVLADAQMRQRNSDMIRAASMVILAARKDGKNPESELARMDISLGRRELAIAYSAAENFRPDTKPIPWRNSESNAGWARLWTFTWQGLTIVILGAVWTLLIDSQLRAMEAVGLPFAAKLRQVMVCGLVPMAYLVAFLIVHVRDLSASFLIPAHPVAHVLPFLLLSFVTWGWGQVIDGYPYKIRRV